MSHNFHILSKVGVGIMEDHRLFERARCILQDLRRPFRTNQEPGNQEPGEQEKLDVVDVFQGLRRYTNKANEFGCAETAACSDLF